MLLKGSHFLCVDLMSSCSTLSCAARVSWGFMSHHVSCIMSHVKYISYHPDVPLLAVPQIIYELFSGFIESVEVSSWCLNVVIKWEPAFIWAQPLWGPAFIWTHPFLTNLCNLEVVVDLVKSLQTSFSLYSNDYTV